MRVEIRGIPAAPGVAIGPVWLVGTDRQAGDPLADQRMAAERASAELSALADRLRTGGHPDEAGILDAQALMAVDPVLLDEAEAIARRAGRDDPEGLADAIRAAFRAAAEGLERLDDGVIAARSSDVRDVGARIARIITGLAPRAPDRPSVLVADDLAPSMAAEFPPELMAGMALEHGSVASHAAIIARELRIPAVVGAAGLLAALEHALGAAGAAAGSRVIALDGGRGTVVIDPADDELRAS